jgi:hypothetical protein
VTAVLRENRVYKATLFGCGSIVGAAVAIAGVTIAEAELDPVKLSPQLYTVRLDNDQVRVYENCSTPGVKDPMHSHPHGLLYIVAGDRMRSTSPAGVTSDVDL